MFRRLILYLLLSLLIMGGVVAQDIDDDLCQIPLLSRLESHTIADGETVDSIARQYNLVPETLYSLNPALADGLLGVGDTILIPPFNGIRVELPEGGTWRDLENAYGVRADVLFEVNGCQLSPQFVFIPGVTWQPDSLNPDNYTGLSGYPLSTVAEVGLGYGWQNLGGTRQTMFHSGVDLLAPVGSLVLAPEKGRVVFTGNEGTYGKLIVMDHGRGRQTRYAHLNQVRVQLGQEVETGDILATVGNSGLPDIGSSHLHFEVRYKRPTGWVAQDPLLHLPR